MSHADVAVRLPDQREIEFVFEPQDEGGYHVYAPDLPCLHTQGEDIEEATENAREALGLYMETLRVAPTEHGRANPGPALRIAPLARQSPP